jgi:hypothetical protein
MRSHFPTEFIRLRTFFSAATIAMLTSVCLAGTASTQKDFRPVNQLDYVKAELKKRATTGDAYLVIDGRTIPSVKYLMLTHTRGPLDKFIGKSGFSLLTGATLSLAPGLLIHVVIIPSEDGRWNPVPSYQQTATSASTVAAASSPTASLVTTPAKIPFGKTDTIVPTKDENGHPIPANKDLSAVLTTVSEYSHADLLTPATGSVQITYQEPDPSNPTGSTTAVTTSITITKAPVWDFQSSFSPTFVLVEHQSPQFAIGTTVYNFGNNSNLSLDTLGIFGTGATTQTNLGQALSYSTVIGSSYVNTGKDLFGFAVGVKLSLGVSTFNLSNHTWGTTPFIGVGFSIPLKTKS